MKNKYPMVMVEWVDTYTDSRWQTREDLINDSKEFPYMVKTLGFLLNKNKRYVLVSPTFAVNHDKHGNGTHIPTKSIKKITKLKI